MGRPRESGFSYAEVIIGTLVLTVALLPALDALRAGILSADIAESVTAAYVRLRDKAKREGWIGKLRYLLYQGGITERDAMQFAGLEGVLLQSKPGDDGMSQNSHIAKLQ